MWEASQKDSAALQWRWWMRVSLWNFTQRRPGPLSACKDLLNSKQVSMSWCDMSMPPDKSGFIMSCKEKNLSASLFYTPVVLVKPMLTWRWSRRTVERSYIKKDIAQTNAARRGLAPGEIRLRCCNFETSGNYKQTNSGGDCSGYVNGKLWEISPWVHQVGQTQTSACMRNHIRDKHSFTGTKEVGLLVFSLLQRSHRRNRWFLCFSTFPQYSKAKPTQPPALLLWHQACERKLCKCWWKPPGLYRMSTCIKTKR